LRALKGARSRPVVAVVSKSLCCLRYLHSSRLLWRSKNAVPAERAALLSEFAEEVAPGINGYGTKQEWERPGGSGVPRAIAL
jgi:hypothetical protein